MSNSNLNSTNKFNLIFRSTFLSENKKSKSAYNCSLYVIVSLLFLFAIFLLIAVYSLNLTVDNFVKDLDVSIKEKLFGSINEYSSWTGNSSLNYVGTATSQAVTIGGAVSLGTTLGLSTILSASLAMAFISVFVSLATLIFRKRTIASFVSLGLSSVLFVIVLSLFLVLIIQSSEHVKNFNKYGTAITSAITSDAVNDATNFASTKTAFEAMKTFLTSLAK